MTVFPSNYRLQICYPRSTTSVKLSKEHAGHMDQKFITYSISWVMSRNSRENGINNNNNNNNNDNNNNNNSIYLETIKKVQQSWCGRVHQ